MGHLQCPPLGPAGRDMGPRDFIWLAALGGAARGPIDAEAVSAAIEAIAAGQWLPTCQLVADCMDEMARGGNLSETADARYRLTATGRDTLSLLLSLPVPRPASVLGQVALRLKLAFLDLVDQHERRCHLEGMVCAYEGELAARQSPCATCAARGSYGQLWQSHDLERLHRDLALLRSMAGFTF